MKACSEITEIFSLLSGARGTWRGLAIDISRVTAYRLINLNHLGLGQR